MVGQGLGNSGCCREFENVGDRDRGRFSPKTPKMATRGRFALVLSAIATQILKEGDTNIAGSIGRDHS